MAPKSSGTVEPTDEGAEPDVPNPGVEGGDEWVPPTDTGKVATVTAITSDVPATDKKWTVTEVRTALLALTGTVDVVGGAAVGAQLTMTQQEVDTIAPPLTNIINRSPRLRSMGSASDAVLVVMGLGQYGVRVGGEAMETNRQRKVEAARQEQGWAEGSDDA